MGWAYPWTSLFREGAPRGPLFPPHDAALAEVIERIDSEHELAAMASSGLSPTEVAALERAPTAACLLAEKWIATRELAAADQLFHSLDKKIADELRLLQLKAVACNRKGDAAGSIRLLQPLAGGGGADEETLGILAGAYKRRWEQSRAAGKEDVKALEQSHRYYDRAWQNSKLQSYYPGINAATTALLLGKSDRAGEIAKLVAGVIEKQAATVQQKVGRDLLSEDYWFAATLAEARLLEGADGPAAQSYEAAFVTFATQRGKFETTAAQARAIIRTRGVPSPAVSSVLDRLVPEAGTPTSKS